MEKEGLTKLIARQTASKKGKLMGLPLARARGELTKKKNLEDRVK